MNISIFDIFSIYIFSMVFAMSFEIPFTITLNIEWIISKYSLREVVRTRLDPVLEESDLSGTSNCLLNSCCQI